jgi:ribonuclease P protein component
LALSDEKDLSTTQSPTQTEPRISRPHGDAWRTSGAQTPPHQRPQTTGNHDSAQAARLTSPPAAESFRPEDRIRRRAEFLTLQRHGIRAQSPHFVVYAMRISEPAVTRLGVTVSRRIGSAVVRNRIKRRVRECFRRTLRAMMPAQTGMIVIAKSGAGAIDSATMVRELAAATSSIGQRL